MIGAQAQQGPVTGAQVAATQPPAQPAQQPDMSGQQPRDVSGGDQQPNVTPEEQAQYDQFVKNGLAIIYPGGEHKVAPAVLAHLKGEFGDDEKQALQNAQPPLGESPNDTLAASAVLIVLALDHSAQGAGHQIDDDVVMHGGVAILEELAEVSEAAGIHDYTPKEMEAATYRAVDLFRVSSERVNQDDLKQQFGQIVQANQAGTLNKLLPGIDQGIKENEESQPDSEDAADQASEQAPAAPAPTPAQAAPPPPDQQVR